MQTQKPGAATGGKFVTMRRAWKPRGSNWKSPPHPSLKDRVLEPLTVTWLREEKREKSNLTTWPGVELLLQKI